ncbi:hypothetical protein HLB44_23100 [Aquincola sp. S2]|uniref:Uncharacterized protein n=1 Tax=Pseudaquabacterium terrae TaxID=2732868 RepID=A0ABX2EMJ2_9BURK|nr:hypothetical protein [Aquabacterium terrae]NRF69897.1 hypothetical protein [Aquabacterium terrae]
MGSMSNDRPDDDHWAKTRVTGAATRLIGDEEAYLGNKQHTIGRRIDAEHHELFVVCDPAEALLQQFDAHPSDFIVLHDLGIDASLRLLQGVAGAIRKPVQQLVVRRQGYGVPLALLRFVELPGAAGAAPVRIYSTRFETAVGDQAEALVRTLIGHSRLGVFLVGPQTAADAAVRLHSIGDAIGQPSWRNHQLLWLPVGEDADTRPPAVLLHRHGSMKLHTAPPQADLAHAWPVIGGLWDQLRGSPQAPPPRAPAPAPAPAAEAPTELLPWPGSDVPAAAAAEPAPSAEQANWQQYVRECAALPGMLSCCVFDRATQRPLAHAGSKPGPAVLAAQGAALYDTLCQRALKLGLQPGDPDLALTLAEHHLILHPLSPHPGPLLFAVLDANVANLTLVRMKLHRLDPAGTTP